MQRSVAVLRPWSRPGQQRRVVVLVAFCLAVCGFKFALCPLTGYSSDEKEVYVNESFPWKPVKIEEADCSKLFVGDNAELQQVKGVARTTTLDSDVMKDVSRGCLPFLQEHSFILSSVTKEEEEFPLAFSMLTYRDAAQVRDLLSAIYRPQNYICVHIDESSLAEFRRAVVAMVGCLDNVFVSSRSVDVIWGTYSVLDAEFACMEDLVQRKGWTYFINLTGQEFPLRTNLELVRILKAWNGSSSVMATHGKALSRRMQEIVNQRRSKADNLQNDKSPTVLPDEPAAPHGLTTARGSAHIAVSRAFVEDVVTNPVAQDLKAWSRRLAVPDEAFFNTLFINVQAGTVPGASSRSPSRPLHSVRFKNWQESDHECADGLYVRRICLLSAADLPLLAGRPELFANKFHHHYGWPALRCLAERLFNRTRDGYFGGYPHQHAYYRRLVAELLGRKDSLKGVHVGTGPIHSSGCGNSGFEEFNDDYRPRDDDVSLNGSQCFDGG